MIEGLRARIIEKAAQYFPSEAADPVEVRITPASVRSTNKVFVVEIVFKGSGAARRAIAKMTPDEESEQGAVREYEMLKRLYDNEELRKEGCSVPRPLDFFGELRALLTEEVEGQRLGTVVRRRNSLLSSRADLGEIEALMAGCGRCLKALHRLNSLGTTDRVSETLFPKIESTYEHLVERHALSRERPQELLGTVSAALALLDLRQLPLVRQHGDYCLGNILVREGTLTVVDFTFSSENVIYNDIARFLVSLDILNPYPSYPLFDFRSIPLFRQRFLEGYFGSLSSIGEEEWTMIRLFEIRNTLTHFRSRSLSAERQGRWFFLAVVRPIYRKRLERALAELRKYGPLA